MKTGSKLKLKTGLLGYHLGQEMLFKALKTE